MPFQKGQSGNPGGRPKGVAAALKARYGDNGEKLLAELGKFAFGKIKKCPAHVRVQAIGMLLERGWGKPAQTVVGDPDQPLQHIVRFGGRHCPDGSVTGARS